MVANEEAPSLFRDVFESADTNTVEERNHALQQESYGISEHPIIIWELG